MATPLAPWKFLIEYLISPTPNTLLFVWKSPRFFPQNWNRCNFCLFLSKCCCHGNSLGSLKILDNMFEITDPENPTLHEKLVSISILYANEVMPIRIFGVSLLLRLFIYLKCNSYTKYTKAFCRFFAINSGNCCNILIISQMSTRVHGSMSDEPLTTFLLWKMRSRQGISDSIFKFADP